MNLLDLRGLGTQRTLVLVNGRRHVGSDILGNAVSPDTNTFPTDLIERIDVVTGGNSAVYGSDAIAGVVNFVLKDDFEGVSLDLQTGITEVGDGEETRFSSLMGLNSDSGNANVLLGVEWYERDVAYQKNRDFYVNGWYDPYNNIPTRFPSMPAYAAGSALIPGPISKAVARARRA